MPRLSRREFAALVATATVGAQVAVPLAGDRDTSSRSVTANDIVERIKTHLGVAWRPDTVDTLKAGDLSTIVTGIVTTAMATMDVLRQAVKAGGNVVLTCEPTFYSRADARTPPEGRAAGRGAAAGGPPADPVFAAKNELIARHNLVVFRLSDHWRLRQPNPFAQGLAAALGWTKYQSAADPLRFDLPALTLAQLVGTLRQGLRVRGGLRVVGDPETRVQRIGLLTGSSAIQASLTMLPAVDAIVAGEVREWEAVEYARDAIFAGQKKGLILLSRVVSEEPGMELCANWLKSFVPEVPIRHISAGDPYWRPA